MVGAVALLLMGLGIGFLIDPAGSALRFFLAPLGTQGMASLRADFTAFFGVGGAFALYGVVRQQRQALLVPIALVGVALLGRFVSLAADGAPTTAVPPMVVEAVMVVLLALAYRGMRS
jgi:hypothetical protein